MSIPGRGKEKQQDYHERNTLSGYGDKKQETGEEIDEPVLDEEDLEENNLKEEDADNIDLSDSRNDKSEDRSFSGNEEKRLDI